MAEAEQVQAATCANCGAPLVTKYCGQCGQHERGSHRLQLREVAGQLAESLFDVESALPATFLGLCRNPGEVCRQYIAGRRKKFMNPFGYLLVAISAQLVVGAIASLFVRAAPGDDVPDWVTWALLALLVPIAAAWRYLFQESGRNFAENYVFGLYLLGQMVWVELLVLTPLSLVLPALALGILYFVAWLALVTWAAMGFYALPLKEVLWRVLVAFVAGGFVAVVATGIIMEIWPGSPAAVQAPPAAAL
jgi:hypothetical protein